MWLNEFNEVTHKRLLWDLVKYRIRQISIKYRRIRRPKALFEKFLTMKDHRCKKILQENQDFYVILCKRDILSPSEDMLKLVLK